MSRAVLPGCDRVGCGLQSCGRWALHPYSAEAAARHADECAARHERLAAAARRQARLRTQFFMLPVLVVSQVATFLEWVAHMQSLRVYAACMAFWDESKICSRQAWMWR